MNNFTDITLVQLWELSLVTVSVIVILCYIRKFIAMIDKEGGESNGGDKT